MTAQQINELMSERALPVQYLCGDTDYAHPSAEWFYGEFARALGLFLGQLRATVWQAESNDCDDFARMAAAFAQACHNATPGRPKGTGLAVGEFWYQRTDGQDHAIICAIVFWSARPSLIFMEPQNQRPVTLTGEEIESCFAYRF